MKKYELVDHDGRLAPQYLKQIKALIDIPEVGVRAGELGGFVQGEHNLSHLGSCWVSGLARVSGSAQVSESAQVYGSAHVHGSAQVSGSAWVHGSASVCGSARVSESAQVHGSASVSESAQVCGSAYVYGSARVFESAQVRGSAYVYGSARVFESARVRGSAQVSGSAVIRGFDQILNTVDYFVIQGFDLPITVTANSIHVGCKSFTPDELDDEHKKWPVADVARAKAMIEIALDRILEHAKE